MSDPGSSRSLLGDAVRGPLSLSLGVARGVERRARRTAADAVIAAADAWLRSSETERIVRAVVAHEGTLRLVDVVLDSAAARHVARRAVDAGVIDAALERLVDREELWRLVDTVAGSAAVSEAIGLQSRSAVTDAVDGVRGGAADADDWLERVARRITGRGHDA